MSSSKENLPRVSGVGLLARSIMLARVEGRPLGAVPEIAKRLSPQSRALPFIIAKTSEVAGGNLGGWGAELTNDGPVAELAAAVFYREVLGRIGAVGVPAGIRLTGLDGEAAAAVITEGQAIPVSAPSLSPPVIVAPLTIAGLVVFTLELLRRGNADKAVGYALLRAIVRGSDAAFLSATSGVGILHGLSAIVSGGSTPTDIDYDLAELLASLTGADYEAVSLVTTPAVALGLSLLRDENGARAYPNVGPRGGDVSGVPVIVSAGCPDGYLVAIDGSAIALGDAGIEISMSKDATIEMNSQPAGDIDPATAGVTRVSLFQNEAVGVKFVRKVGWKATRSNVVGYISGLSPLDGIVTA